MGKKKGQNHVQQSMGQLVSKAALAQMGPAIERFVRGQIQSLGSQLAMQQASTLETLFSRLTVLEAIMVEKLGYTKESLAVKVSEMEDEKEGLTLVNGPAEKGDVVRIEAKTRTSDQTEYQGSSRLKIPNIGSGENLGPELEGAVLGMVAGETKTLEFGKDKQMVAEITVNRVSRGPKVEATAPTEGQDGSAQG